MAEPKREVWVIESATGHIEGVKLSFEAADRESLSASNERVVRYVPASESRGQEQRWVPPSEKLPADFHTIQFVTANGPCVGYRVAPERGAPCWVNWQPLQHETYADSEVQCWAPLLPAPPKETA